MATGRIGVTPTLRTRWSKQPTAGTTSLSGLDDNSVALVYDVGYEAVYRNGALLSRGNDYTATDGTTVTLIDATLAGDIIEILANQLVPLTDAISKGQFNAKGALLSATAASTPGVLAVGANDTVLTADSTTSTGLKWATPAAGGMTSIASGSLPTGATSVVLSSIVGTYRDLKLYIRGAYMSPTPYRLAIRVNGDTGTNYRGVIARSNSSSTDNNAAATTTQFLPFYQNDMGSTASQTQLVMTFHDYANTDAFHSMSAVGYNTTNDFTAMDGFTHKSATAITSITILSEGQLANFSGGTYELFGVK